MNPTSHILTLPYSPHILTTYSNIIINHYNESHRTYHTLNHINQLLSLYDSYSDLLCDSCNVLRAILFHDVIYNTSVDGDSKSNEYKSMCLWEEFCKDANVV